MRSSGPRDDGTRTSNELQPTFAKEAGTVYATTLADYQKIGGVQTSITNARHAEMASAPFIGTGSEIRSLAREGNLCTNILEICNAHLPNVSDFFFNPTQDNFEKARFHFDASVYETTMALRRSQMTRMAAHANKDWGIAEHAEKVIPKSAISPSTGIESAISSFQMELYKKTATRNSSSASSTGANATSKIPLASSELSYSATSLRMDKKDTADCRQCGKQHAAGERCSKKPTKVCRECKGPNPKPYPHTGDHTRA